MSFLGVSGLCGLLAMGLIFPLAASGGAVASAGSEILDEVPAEMAEEPLSTPSHFYASDGETLLATFYEEYRVPVDFDDISDEMKAAIVSIEDERFFDHGGVDGRGLARALVFNLTNPTQQGASTLTMQYVNNVLNNAHVVRGEVDNVLAAGIQDKTYADKLREMQLAVSVEQEMTKDEILEGYLNVVLLGGQIYGVEAAAQQYWGISAADLDLAQSATLAGMVQSPNYFNPIANPDEATERRNLVLETMERNGYISAEERDDAMEESLGVEEGATIPINGCRDETAAYFCDFVQRQLVADGGIGEELFGGDREFREGVLARRGLEVVTTLDVDAQEAAEDTVRQYVPAGNNDVAAVIDSIEPDTGNIVAMAQSTRYSVAAEDGDLLVNLSVDTDWGDAGGLPVGSTLKPFAAAAYLEDGGSMDDVVDAREDDYEGETFEASCIDGGSFRLIDPWELSNVNDDHLVRQTVDWGLYNSVNTASAATVHGMDVCKVTELMDRVGIHNASTLEGMNPTRPSFVTGGTEMSPLTLAHAYTVFANDGEQCDLRFLESITDELGNEYEMPEVNCEEKVDPEIIAEVNDTLVNIAEDGSRNSPVPDFPILGKTGTSEESSNLWFAGSSRGLTSVAQIGSFRNTDSLQNQTFNGIPTDDDGWVYGSTYAQPMWNDYMNIVGDNWDTSDFPEADDSPFDDRRESRYSLGDRLGPNGNSSSNNDDDDDDDDD